MVVCYNWSSDQSGVLGVTTPPVSEYAVPIMAKLGTKSFATLPVLRILYRCILLDVSSVFWLFVQSNLILINHPHRLSLAKSEWWMFRKVVVNIQPIKSNAEGSSPLYEYQLVLSELWGSPWVKMQSHSVPFLIIYHNKLLFCSHNIGYTDAGELMGAKLRKYWSYWLPWTPLPLQFHKLQDTSVLSKWNQHWFSSHSNNGTDKLM